MQRQATFPRSGVLILGSNSIHSLVPATLISQVEALLDGHRVPDALALAEHHRKRIQGNHIVNEDEADELRYVYQRIGFQCFTETLFEDAGKCFFNGELDPRLLVSFFPDLRGEMFLSTETIDMYAGVAENVPEEDSVDDLISMNLVRNYSPHLPPNTKSAPSTAELAKILQTAARDMLEIFMRRCQSRYRAQSKLGIGLSTAGAGVRPVVDEKTGLIAAHVVVDTVLAKLYAINEKTSALYDLISSPVSAIIISELEEVLQRTGQYCALCMLYKQHGQANWAVNRGKILGILAKLVEGEWSDEDVKDPLSEMILVLSEKTKDREGDRTLLRRWSIWVLKHDMERGLQLLISDREQAVGKRRGTVNKKDDDDDISLLEEISQADEEAGQRFLEFLVIRRRSSNPELHSKFAVSCVERLSTLLASDESIEKLWRAKSSSYASTFPALSLSSTRLHTSPSHFSILSPIQSKFPQPQLPPQSQSFLSYFASTTPDSSSKRLRLKTILFLAGSSNYDPAQVKEKLSTGPDAEIAETQEEDKGRVSSSSKAKSSLRKRGKGLLSLELAIVEGKLSNHKGALQTLVHEVNDAYSAEAYCALGGEVVPKKVALAVVESCPGLEGWADVLFGSAPPVANGAVNRALMPPPLVISQPSGSSQVNGSEEGKKRDLLKTLLGVYMHDEEISAGRAAHLLNSQAMNLDVYDVIDLIPPHWPVEAMTSFLVRSFRRMLHARHEGKIIKNLSTGQNLAVKERTWHILREEGMIVEEAVSDDEEGDEVSDEKAALLEKVALAQSDAALLGPAYAPSPHDSAAVNEKEGLGGEGDADEGEIHIL